ncbi:MAG: LPD29 domain-containing protein [Halarcobacter ebronensis]|uniref:LPD29 domain-containing protein n=1 Tax=Halarcobacter ebronensis TaxID=1462615 RepID=UPI003C78C941
MAFISTEEVKNIRTQLKKELPNLKFSVKKRDHSKVFVTIKSGDLDFLGTLKKEVERDYITVWKNFENQFTDIEIIETLKKIDDIVYGQNYHDNSDPMIDYFDVSYYAEIKIGDWDKPYQLNQQQRAA